jgi:Peptidase family M20/M25/M40
LRRIGLDNVGIIPTARHPLIYGSWQRAAGRPTLLIYGHYDVQPADPLHEWHSPPFEPAIRGANLFGRGACDDKGQMFTHVKALEAYLQTTGTRSTSNAFSRARKKSAARICSHSWRATIAASPPTSPLSRIRRFSLPAVPRSITPGSLVSGA